MKLALLILVALAVASTTARKRTEEEIEQFKKWHSECGEDDETKELLDKARHGECFDNPKLAKHFLCYYKKIGWLNSEGKFDVTETRKSFEKYYEEPEVNELMSKCVVEKSTPEETAVALLKCWQTIFH